MQQFSKTVIHRSPAPNLVKSQCRKPMRHLSPQGTSSQDQKQAETKKPEVSEEKSERSDKTMAQIDEELRLKMEGLAGDGGESGLELEDGKPVSMKRGVRDNMFRYI